MFRLRYLHHPKTSLIQCLTYIFSYLLVHTSSHFKGITSCCWTWFAWPHLPMHLKPTCYRICILFVCVRLCVMQWAPASEWWVFSPQVILLMQSVSVPPAGKELHHLTVEMCGLGSGAGRGIQFPTMWDIIITPVFLHVFQVYQYMHETITVNGCPEYQARATAKVRAAPEICRRSLHYYLEWKHKAWRMSCKLSVNHMSGWYHSHLFLWPKQNEMSKVCSG